MSGFMGWCRREEINVWFKRKGNTAIKLKQGRRGVEGVGQRLCWVRESSREDVSGGGDSRGGVHS